VSVPTGFQSVVLRYINCDVTEDDDQHSITIDIHSSRTAYFYLDPPEIISRLQKLAESEFDRALQTLDELRGTVFHSSLGREYHREMQDVVDSMQGNLTAKHYEFVLDKLDRVEQLKTLALQEEEDYARTELFVSSVRQDMLDSQGHLGKWQLFLLTQAYENLDQGNYTSAVEWARQAKDLPRESVPQADPTLAGVLSTASLVLLGMVAIPTIFRASRCRESKND